MPQAPVRGTDPTYVETSLGEMKGRVTRTSLKYITLYMWNTELMPNTKIFVNSTKIPIIADCQTITNYVIFYTCIAPPTGQTQAFF